MKLTAKSIDEHEKKVTEQKWEREREKHDEYDERQQSISLEISDNNGDNNYAIHKY